MHPRQIEDRIDLAHEMIGRNNIIKIELVEQLALIAVQPPHHRKSPPRNVVHGRNHCSPPTSTDFCNKIGTPRTDFGAASNLSATAGTRDRPRTRIRDWRTPP